MTEPRRYTFKLYPNATQAEALEHHRRLHCNLYNALLQQREEAWRRAGKSLTWYDQQKEITALRKADPEYAALSADTLAQTAKRLDLAFQAFFRRVKSGYGVRAGFPRFQPGRTYPGMSNREHGKGWKLTLQEPKPNGKQNGKLYVKGVPGTIKVRGKFPAEPEKYKTMDLTLRDGCWWMSLVAAMQPRRAPGHQDVEVRFDLIDSFARINVREGGCAARSEAIFDMADGQITLRNQAVKASSDAATAGTGGERRYDGWVMVFYLDAATAGSARRNRDDVEDIQRAMSRCKKGSWQYRELRRIKARRQARAARRRKEELHRWTTMVTTAASDLTVIRPRSVQDQTASGRGTERDPGAAVAAKAAFNRRVLNQVPTSAAQMLAYKAAEAGAGYHETTDDRVIKVGNLLVRATKEVRKARRVERRKYQPKAA